jgi:hypothetical protein
MVAIVAMVDGGGDSGEVKGVDYHISRKKVAVRMAVTMNWNSRMLTWYFTREGRRWEPVSHSISAGE